MKTNRAEIRKHSGRWGFLFAAALFAVAAILLINPIQTKAGSKVVMPADVFEEVNDIRAYYGLDDLDWDEALASFASVRAIESSTFFSHTRPDGTPWYTVSPAEMEGENLLWTSLDRNEVEIVSLWMQSPSHRELILDNGFDTMGIAGYTAEDGVHYWVIEFGY